MEKKKYICEHCNRQIQNPQALRWHEAGCKLKTSHKSTQGEAVGDDERSTDLPSGLSPATSFEEPQAEVLSLDDLFDEEKEILGYCDGCGSAIREGDTSCGGCGEAIE